MAVFLGTAEYVLEEGPANDWFDDAAVRYAAIAFVIGMALFFWRAVTARQPIVDLSAFSDRNFATGAFFSFVMGIGLYGLTYLYPVFLGRVRGYSSMMIGETMFVTGIAMFVAAPIVGRLSAKLDPRILIGRLCRLRARHLAGLAGHQGLGVQRTARSRKSCAASRSCCAWCRSPMRRSARCRRSGIKNASGLFNLTRNLGGAVGLALINTVLNDRMDLHLAAAARAGLLGTATLPTTRSPP